MKLLDLFCGAGGASMGYRNAGFTEIVGVDIKPQPNYPFTFIQFNALEFAHAYADDFDAVHASPPCQAYTRQGKHNLEHPQLINPIRELIQHRPYIIENVVDAPLVNPIVLCGSMFNLGVRRHRLFESNLPLTVDLTCKHKGQDIRAYYGAWGREAFRAKKPGNKDVLRGHVDRSEQDMGINWMTWKELTQAIPPAYTEYIGKQIISQI